jgi:hypothetical protein
MSSSLPPLIGCLISPTIKSYGDLEEKVIMPIGQDMDLWSAPMGEDHVFCSGLSTAKYCKIIFAQENESTDLHACPHICGNLVHGFPQINTDYLL